MKLSDLVILEEISPRIFAEVKKLLRVAEAAKRYTEWQKRNSSSHEQLEQHFADLREINAEIVESLKDLEGGE